MYLIGVFLFIAFVIVRVIQRQRVDEPRILAVLESGEELTGLDLAKRIGRTHPDYTQLRAMEERGLIESVRRRNPQTGFEATFFRLPVEEG